MKFERLFQPLGVAAAVSACVYSMGAQAAAWEDKHFNPMPDKKEDVVLPMPCEGSMVFRRVYVPGAGPLDDHAIKVGQEGAGFKYVENAKTTHIAGSFSEAKSKSRYYLMAKYELTELQYKALTESTCPPASNRLRVPMVNVSWLDAMKAADAYNRWLRTHAADKLPKEDKVPGFVRLPTETEWEYAARGGMKVQTAEYADVHYPMPEGMNAHEWFAGAQSANGKLQLAGQLKPNPLGLHDMLGNVDELVMEPFRLNKLDRDHGQAGGYVVRGGNYLQGAAEIRSSQRAENDYYDAKGARTAKTTGFRLVVVAPSLTSNERMNAINKSWEGLGVSAAAEAGNKTTVHDGLKALSAQVEDKKLKEQLKKLEGDLRASNLKEEEARAKIMQSSLNLGAFLCTKMLDDGKFLETLQRNYEMTCKGENALSGDSCTTRQARLKEQEDRVGKLGLYYADHVLDSADLYGEKALAQQVPIFEEKLTANPRLKGLTPYLKVHWDNSKSYFKNKKIDSKAWLKSCKEVKSS